MNFSFYGKIAKNAEKSQFSLQVAAAICAAATII
jgi:hypothetical protein